MLDLTHHTNTPINGNIILLIRVRSHVQHSVDTRFEHKYINHTVKSVKVR